ncbi:MAG: transporter substrate-binding domain-containing protein [Proteobacteria bacterium]|nr:transporter substrate-binding domain-containing protein [Pseudomonadota bacterium]
MNHLTSLFFIAIALYSEVAVAATDCTAWKRDSNDTVNQTSSPCYWYYLASNLTKAATSQVEIDKQIKTTAPELVDMIRRDAKNQKIFDLWGGAINFDEDLKNDIVSPKLLSVLGKLLGHKIKGKIVNAGILSTYGYLLSNAVTPYGFKRDGWTERLLDYGFGWKGDIISPIPQHGTLLTNVTALAGIIAFRDDPTLLKVLADATTDAAPEIRNMNLDALDIRRLVETITLTDAGKGKDRTVELRTDLVTLPFEVSPAKALTHLMIYSVKDSASVGGAKLISVAPTTQDTVDAIFSPRGLGENQLIRTQYNAFIPELNGKKKTGRRWVQVKTNGISQPNIIINDDYWPPYNFGGVENQPKGFIRELVEQCLPTTGWKAEFHPMPISRMRKLIEQGDLDINIFSFEKSRESFLTYGSESLFTSEYQPAVRADSTVQINKIEDFDQLRLGHLNGLSYSPAFKAYVDKRLAEGRLDVADSENTNLNKLIGNRIDTFVNHKRTILWFAKKLGVSEKIKMLNFTIKRADYFVAFAKSSKRLSPIETKRFLSAMDGCIRNLKQNNDYNVLRERYGLVDK